VCEGIKIVTNIGHIQTTFDNVKRDVQSVHVRKASIGHKLSQLQSRLVDLHCLYPSVDNKPLLFNSGTYFLGIDANIALKLY